MEHPSSYARCYSHVVTLTLLTLVVPLRRRGGPKSLARIVLVEAVVRTRDHTAVQAGIVGDS